MRIKSAVSSMLRRTANWLRICVSVTRTDSSPDPSWNCSNGKNAGNWKQWYVMIITDPGRRSGQVGPAPPASSADQRDQEQNDKDKEEDLCDLCGARGDAEEAQRTCNERYNEEN